MPAFVTSRFFRDARHYQIAALATLVIFPAVGIVFRGNADISWQGIAVD